MSTVVLNIETNHRHGQTRQHCQRQGLPPGGCRKNQKTIKPAKGQQNDPGLQVHFRAVTLPAAGGAKKFVYSSSQLDLKTVVSVKCQSGIHRLICLSAQTLIPSLSHIFAKHNAPCCHDAYREHLIDFVVEISDSALADSRRVQ